VQFYGQYEPRIKTDVCSGVNHVDEGKYMRKLHIGLHLKVKLSEKRVVKEMSLFQTMAQFFKQ
jgi:hypothetical protein